MHLEKFFEQNLGPEYKKLITSRLTKTPNPLHMYPLIHI